MKCWLIGFSMDMMIMIMYVDLCGCIWMYVVDVHVYYPAIIRDIPWDCPQNDMALAIEKSIILGDSWDENKIYIYTYIIVYIYMIY